MPPQVHVCVPFTTEPQLGYATRVPENPGNPPVFKPVNPGLCAVKKPGFYGFNLILKCGQKL